MKTKLFIFLLALLVCIGARAQVFSTNLMLNFSLPVGTNPSVIYQAPGSLNLGQLVYQFQNGGLPTTNTLTYRARLAIGNTNSWLVLTNWVPPATNAAQYNVPLNLSGLPVFLEVDVVSTNPATPSSTSILHN